MHESYGYLVLFLFLSASSRRIRNDFLTAQASRWRNFLWSSTRAKLVLGLSLLETEKENT